MKDAFELPKRGIIFTRFVMECPAAQSYCNACDIGNENIALVNLSNTKQQFKTRSACMIGTDTLFLPKFGKRNVLTDQLHLV